MGDTGKREDTSPTGFSAWIDRNYRAVMLISMLLELLLLGYIAWKA